MERLTLSMKELDRICILSQVTAHKITQIEASASLGLTTRQVRRMLRRYESDGPEGLKSRRVGLCTRSFSSSFKAEVLHQVRAHYYDFGPTFASEKLLECHQLKVNRETLRQWMVEEGLWSGRIRKDARIHQSRERRPRFGELVQIDGSHHDWFEGRGPKCCLLVFIDDATSQLVSMRFEESETTLGYMRCTLAHIKAYGRPLMYYSDKHSVFKTTREECVDGFLQDTQYHRALRELGIELVCAHSSQAKGRVERANKTLQDRLIKELRLQRISSIEKANAYLPTFIKNYNKKFSVKAAHPEDAHRALHHQPDALRRILSVQRARKVSKNLEVSFENTLYQIIRPGGGYQIRGAQVMVCELMDGTQELWYGTESLLFKKMLKTSRQPRTVDYKGINSVVDGFMQKRASLPSVAHVTHRVHEPRISLAVGGC